MNTSEIEQAFILHWGEMGGSWGITRATAQVHALLMLSESPRDAQSICERLSIARSNISTSLRELQRWGLIRTVHNMGDRRDYFEAEKDVWKALQIIADRRLEREILPTLELLKRLQAENPKKPAHLSKTMQDFIDVFGSTITFYRALRVLPKTAVKRALAFDRRMRALVSGGKTQ